MLATLKKSLYSAIIIAVFAALTAIILQIICTAAYADSGILTLKFNFTDALADVLPSPTHALHDRDLLEDLQNGAKSALNAAATKVIDVASQAESRITSAVSQAESAISSATATLKSIEEIVPQNCSLGTKRFCIGYKQNINCSNLPLNFSSLLLEGVQKLPGPVQDAMRDRAEDLSQLVKSSTRFPALSVLDTLISGLVLMSIVMALSLSLALRRPQVVTRVFDRLKAMPRALTLLALGFICYSPLVLLGFILNTILKTASGLLMWIGVEKGGVCGLGFAALACALVLVLALPAAPNIARPVKGEGIKSKE
ncbi:hypothetical protein J3E74DRAFT_295812 [Bipolaris maydis]|nr:hypothetical protein J3E74DRAFT_296960 [Bipolaris maydis]KAJ5051412.1 hypothetical protein J3E74DRAFT_295812 [Bipolaris maydis]